MNKIPTHIAELLNIKLKQYQSPAFIDEDPVSIPHLFDNPKDIEIAAFLTAIISWGNRKSIIKSAQSLMKLMQWKPHAFVMNYTPADNKLLKNFYYRTFQPEDTVFFIHALHRYYKQYDSLEKLFIGNTVTTGIQALRTELLYTLHKKRSEKHLPDIDKGSAAKRINMFLRWMVRKDEIDFGIWKNIHTSDLLIPLDIHTARTAQALELLPDNKSNLKNTLHLTALLKTLDPYDPVKYDFALFGMSIYEKNTRIGL